VELSALVKALDTELDARSFKDYCPNGLQVEGRPDVERLVTGVTASQALIDAAIEQGADAILVHHGYFWRGEPAEITGMKARRIRALLGAGVSLLAYHLPLDAHPRLGNNARLGALMGWESARAGDDGLLWYADLPQAETAVDIAGRARQLLGREPLLEAVGETPVKRVAWCTGAAQSFLGQAADIGADLFLTGEVSEPTIHEARERGVHFIAAGHHATERYGVKALGEWVADRFDISQTFIDIDNPA